MLAKFTQFKNNITKEGLFIFFSIVFLAFYYDNIVQTGMDAFKDRVEFSNFMNFSVKILQNVIFGFLLINIFCKFRYSYIGYLLPLAYWEQSYNFFANTIHGFLLNSGFYSLFSKTPQMISPEYPRVVLFFFILLASLILVFQKKWRTFQRIFLVLSSLGVFITAILFHSIIIYEIGSFKNQDAAVMNRIIKISENPQEIIKACNINHYSCFVYEKYEEEFLFDDEHIPAYVRKELPYFNEYFHSQQNIFWYGIAHDPTAKNRLVGQTPFSLSRTPKFSTIILNDGTYKEFFIVNQYVFAWLAMASHTVWFFGALLLIFFHGRKFSQKTKQ